MVTCQSSELGWEVTVELPTDFLSLGRGSVMISVDGNVANLDKQSGNVESENKGLKERVRVAFQLIQNAVKPIPLSVS